ncbi:MAG TPA: tetratricopeptide repeat protein, partial [Bdellovibrionota bacterium]|nr:tetratricopeptide repeat protein [Bdellovibrionota bacterium]
MQVLRSALPFKLALTGLALLASLAGGTAEARSPYSEGELRAVESQDEAKVRELREQEITQLRIVLGRRQPVNRQADLYFRLAEIYLEGYHAAFLLEGRAHERRLEKGIEDKLIDRTHSVPFLRNGIKACQEVIKTGIAYEKMDHIYYFLAFNNAELGNRQESVNYFDKLARQYPQSPFVSEAYKELGDASFENKEYDKARQYYELALRKAPPDIAPRILHKLAWTFHRLKQHDRAVETMKRTIETAQKSGEKFVNLKEEALRDMAIFMTESGRVEEAIAYLREKSGDPKFYAKALERLGAQYERSVQPEKAALVYDSLLKTNPDSEEAFRVTVKLVDLDLRRNRYNEALKRIQAVQVPGKREGPTEVAAQNLKSMTRRTATEHHEKFRRAGNKISLQIAEDYYTVYLTSFLAKEDSRQETPEIEMYLAEVKREMGKAKEASQLYRKVLDSKDKRYAKEAGALWIASLVEALKKDPGARSGKTEPSDVEKQFVEAADLMQETIGETPEAREASLRAAQVLAGYASTRKESVQRIRKVMARWPRSPQAQTAARLWVQLQSDQITAAAKGSSGDQADALKGMDEAIAEIRGNAELMAGDAESGQGKLKLLLAEQDTKIRIGAITKSESDKDYVTAAKGYERFAAEARDKEQAEKAFSSTVASYLKADDGANAERVLGAWLKRYPKSPKAVELSRSASSQFLIQGRFEAAGSLFERLGREAGDPDSLETAARIFDGLGDRVRAQRAWSSHLSSYPNSPNRFAVALTLARSYETAGQDADAAAAYKVCFKSSSPLEPECGARLADLYFRTRNPEAGKAALARVAANRSPAAKKKPKKKAAQEESSGPASSPFVGYARYRLAEMLEKSKRFDPITLPETRLTRAVKQRLDFLEPLARAYTLAVDAGGPWAISALDRLAAFAYTFADDL